jgi:dihydrofolate synthase/folylpolyglutamate synthase
LKVIEGEATGVGAEVAAIGRDFDVTSNETAVGGRFLSLRASRGEYEDLFLPLHGAHQGVNATLAVESVLRFLGGQTLTDDVVAEGFAKTSVPGRLESLAVRDTSVVIDVAHNPDGMSAFVSGLLGAFAFERLIVVFGVLEEKDYLGMLTELTRVPCHVIATEPKSVRALAPDVVAGAAQNLGLSAEVVLEIDAALDHALATAGEGELVCVTGSHYVVGDARTHLLGKRG